MGSTVYTQKLKHPVFVSFTCEHCGLYNSFSQDIVGVSRTEVNYIRSSKYTQEQVGKLGPQAEANMANNLHRAKTAIDKSDYSWLKLHKCTKCHYAQSWQTGRIWRRSIKFFVLDLFIFFIFFSWLTGSSSPSITSENWLWFTVLGLLVMIPIVVLVLSLVMRDKEKRNKPDIRI